MGVSISFKGDYLNELSSPVRLMEIYWPYHLFILKKNQTARQGYNHGMQKHVIHPSPSPPGNATITKLAFPRHQKKERGVTNNDETLATSRKHAYIILTPLNPTFIQ